MATVAKSFDVAALAERLFSQERTLSEFKETTSLALADITKQIQHLATHMDSRMRPQWGVLLSAFGAIMYVLIYFVIQPMQRDMERTNQVLMTLQAETQRGFHDLRQDTIGIREFSQHVEEGKRLEQRLYALEVRLSQPARQ